MERKIGEYFVVEGKLLQCVEGKNCNLCCFSFTNNGKYFRKNCCQYYNEHGYCSNNVRSDAKSVHYVYVGSVHIDKPVEKSCDTCMKHCEPPSKCSLQYVCWSESHKYWIPKQPKTFSVLSHNHHLLNAMVKDLVDIGYKNTELIDTCTFREKMLIVNDSLGIKHGIKFGTQPLIYNKEFRLPEQYMEALNFAKEQINIK